MVVSCPIGSNLQDPTNCATIFEESQLILDPFERPPDTPVLIDRSLFSQNLQSNLEQCDGTTSCKYVGFDFEADTGTRINNMKYTIDISQVGGSKGVFTKELQTVPTMMIAPPGYTYSFESINGVPIGATCTDGGTINTEKGYCQLPATHDYNGVLVYCSFYCDKPGYVPDGFTDRAFFPCWSTRECKKEFTLSAAATGDILSCKISCDSDATCKGFNYNSALKQCTLYSNINVINSYSYNPTTISFTRQNFPTLDGERLIPGAKDSATYLGNTGDDCGKMTECNSNLAHVFDTPGVTSFSTTDIETCGFCPIKTVNKVSSDYYVRDEVGKTTKYTQKASAIAALQYSNFSNPYTTTSSNLNALYKITPYTGTKSRNIFITSSKNIIFVHAEHHNINTIDLRTGEPATGFYANSSEINAVQFSYVLDDGSVMPTLSTLSQFGVDNKISTMVGNGTTTTVTTVVPHGLSSTSSVFLYGALPSPFLIPTIVNGNITIIQNPVTSNANISFSFSSTYSGTTTAGLFFSKTKDRGIPSWDMIPVDYVTNGFQFRTTGSRYLTKNTFTAYTSTKIPLFFGSRGGRPDKYRKEFADTVFILERVQTGSSYTKYECPAYDRPKDDCFKDGEKHRGHTWFLKSGQCECSPTFNRIAGTLTCLGVCTTGCPPGFTKHINEDSFGHVGCLDYLTNWGMLDACRYEPNPTTFTVDTQYDMIFEMFTGSGIYDYPENMIFQSLTGMKYLLENKRLRKIQNDTMYYYLIKNSGTDNWNTLIVPSQEMIDDMPKGTDYTVTQNTGSNTDNSFYNVNINTPSVNGRSSVNYENLTQIEWLTQILGCADGSYSAEGIKPCTVCAAGSGSTTDRKGCVCTSQYTWNSSTNFCDLNSCTGNKYNLNNGKEPCTECVSGSTVSSDHKSCVCPPVLYGTHTWQSGTNTCSLVCNIGFTAYGEVCIDNMPDIRVQNALNFERQRIQVALTPTAAEPPANVTNADIQNALNLERQRVMDSLINTGPMVDDITPITQASVDIERQRVMDSLRTGLAVDDITPVVQSQLNVMVSGASKFSVPCNSSAGYYSNTGYEPCTPCSVCTTPNNATDESTGCSSPWGRICGFSCNAGYYMHMLDCLSCPMGSTSSAGGIGRGSCIVSEGYYIPTGAKDLNVPVIVPAGYYRAGGGAVGTYSNPQPQECADGSWSSAGATSCAAWKDCSTPTGQYQTNIPSATENRVCGTCPIASSCSATQYLGGTCANSNGTNTTACRACGAAPNCGGSQWYAPCTATSNTGACANLTVCSLGSTYETQSPTATRDRKCEGVCTPRSCTGTDQWYTACTLLANSIACATRKQCGTGEYQTNTPSATENRTCGTCLTTCGNNQYLKGTCPNNNSTSTTSCESCGAAPTCGTEQWYAPCTATTPTGTCANWSVCSLGSTYETQSPTATRDRKCEGVCTPRSCTGTDQWYTACTLLANSIACATRKQCGTGEYQTNTPSATENRTCGTCLTVATAGCINGQYLAGICPNNNSTNTTYCKACATCPPAPTNMVLTQGGCSGTTDRTCEYACASGFTPNYNVDGFLASCTCPGGRYINSTTGTCEPCTDCSGLTNGLRTSLTETAIECQAGGNVNQNRVCQACPDIFMCNNMYRGFYIYNHLKQEYIGDFAGGYVDSKSFTSTTAPYTWYYSPAYKSLSSIHPNNLSATNTRFYSRSNNRVDWTSDVNNFTKWNILYNPYYAADFQKRGSHVTFRSIGEPYHLNNCKSGSDLQSYHNNNVITGCDTFSLIFTDTVASFGSWSPICTSNCPSFGQTPVV